MVSREGRIYVTPCLPHENARMGGRPRTSFHPCRALRLSRREFWRLSFSAQREVWQAEVARSYVFRNERA